MRVNWVQLAARVLPRAHAQHEVTLAGVALVLDRSGALYWPEHGLLLVSDLHLEKGSSFARRGSLVPPYDTHDTLTRLGELVVRYAPRVVVSLGDNFHDGEGAGRLSQNDRETLTGLQRGRDWVWITGNHDPEPAEGVGGIFAEELVVGPLWFRHKGASSSKAPPVAFFPSPLVGEGGSERSEEPGEGFGLSACHSGAALRAEPGMLTDGTGARSMDSGQPLRGFRNDSSGEISGHLHPVAVVSTRGVGVRRRCFASDGTRMVMPAFGAYAGGLNIRHAAFGAVFGAAAVTAHVIGDERLFAIGADRCV